jgi:anti-sigma regulatory factor (Ser/Thr protein kinase)
MPHLALELPADRDAPARAREALRRLTGGLGEEDQWRAAVIVSELVSNAVLHGAGSPVEIVLDCGGSGVRGSVSDPGPGVERVRERAPGRADGGRGLFLIDQLADGWGLVEDRSRVWFEVTATAT